MTKEIAKRIDVLELFKGQGEYTRANKEIGLSALGLDVDMGGKAMDMMTASGFLLEPFLFASEY